MKRVHLGMASLLVIVMVLMTGAAYAQSCGCGGCCDVTVMKPVEVEEEVVECQPFTEQVPVIVMKEIRTKKMVTQMKPVTVKKMVTVMKPVCACNPCPSPCGGGCAPCGPATTCMKPVEVEQEVTEMQPVEVEVECVECIPTTEMKEVTVMREVKVMKTKTVMKPFKECRATCAPCAPCAPCCN